MFKLSMPMIAYIAAAILAILGVMMFIKKSKAEKAEDKKKEENKNKMIGGLLIAIGAGLGGFFFLKHRKEVAASPESFLPSPATPELEF